MPAGLRVPVLRLRRARPGADRQPGGQDPLHAGRQGLGAAGDALSRPAPAPAPPRSTARSLEAWLAHVPGLKVVQPSTPHDIKGMLLAAIDDPDPVMVFEHKLLYKMKGDVPAEPYRVPIGKAIVRARGHQHLPSSPPRSWCIRALEAAEIARRRSIDSRGHRSAHPAPDRPRDHHRERQEDRAPRSASMRP